MIHSNNPRFFLVGITEKGGTYTFEDQEHLEQSGLCFKEVLKVKEVLPGDEELILTIPDDYDVQKKFEIKITNGTARRVTVKMAPRIEDRAPGVKWVDNLLTQYADDGMWLVDRRLYKLIEMISKRAKLEGILK